MLEKQLPNSSGLSLQDLSSSCMVILQIMNSPVKEILCRRMQITYVKFM